MSDERIESAMRLIDDIKGRLPVARSWKIEQEITQRAASPTIGFARLNDQRVTTRVVIEVDE